MRRTKLTAFALTLLAALMLVAAGCGGGSKNSAATTEAATTEAATTETTTTEAATTTTEAATTEAATTEAQTSTSALGGLVASGKCKDLANLGQKYSQALSGSGGGQDLKKTAQIVQEFADKAPSEIRSDFQVVADYMSKVAAVAGNLKPGQVPDAATIAKLQKLGTSIDSQKLTQASQNITAWVAKNCRA